MNRAISLGYYESLIVHTEVDFNNLKESFELLKNNTFDKKLITELYQNYSYLLQDIKYIEKFKQNISEFDVPISVKFLKGLEEIKILLEEVKEFLIDLNFNYIAKLTCME